MSRVDSFGFLGRLTTSAPGFWRQSTPRSGPTNVIRRALSVWRVPVLAAIALVLTLTARAAEGAQNTAAPPPAKIVHFHLSGLLTETPKPGPFSLLADVPESVQHLLAKLDRVRRDPAVKALVITVDGLQSGYAHAEELHGAFRALNDAGKPVHVHAEEASLSTAEYALLTGAATLNLAPTSFLDLTGLYLEGLYLKEGLDKLGVRAEIIHIGDYKSAGEFATRTGPSEAADEAMNWLMDGLYEGCVSLIAEGRGLTPEQVRKHVDGGPYTAERAHELGLIDSLQYRDEFLAEIRETYGEEAEVENAYGEPTAPEIDVSNPFAFLSFILSDLKRPSKIERPDSVAVVTVEGVIMPGFKEPASMGAGGVAHSGDIRNYLEEAAADDSVKAVVLRVESPGGSVTASEVILRAAEQVADRKPLVVSMGNVAASGGYYVATKAESIFASASTITGSIGVVGGKVVTDDMWGKLGVTWHSYQRGANAGWMSPNQPFTEEQRAKTVAYMEAAYDTFKAHVTAGRGQKLGKAIEEVAGGRVYTGKQAQALGLVDQLGGLQESIAHAASLAALENFTLRPIPDPGRADESFFDFLFGTSEPNTDLALPGDPTAAAAPSAGWSPHGPSRDAFPLSLLRSIDPARTRTAMQLFQCAGLLNQERMLAITPQLLAIP